MTTQPTSKRLTIFEGCDGTGKSTAAKQFAAETGAKYVHFSAMPRVGFGLGRMYVEAMLPALLGHQDVVFDRCWLSETPYGVVFREGQDRLGDASKRMLERLALRCGAVLVRCDPGWEAVERSFRARKHLEMLDDTAQLAQVYGLYETEPSCLPTIRHDYTFGHGAVPFDAIEATRTGLHPLGLASAGNWGARIVLVGDCFAERKDQDSFYQWPFGSFSKLGCSQWLAQQLDHVHVSEFDLLWVNADQQLGLLPKLQHRTVIALGDTALRITGQRDDLGALAHVPRPQHFKRFGGRARYPLLDILQGC